MEKTLRNRLEDVERDRARAVERLEKAKSLLLEMREIIEKKNRKILYYRMKTIILSVFICVLLGLCIFFVFYPESGFRFSKGVNTCLLNTISIFKTDSKDGYPSDSFTRDAEELSKEEPATDVTMNGYGNSSPEHAEESSETGSSNEESTAGRLRE